MARESISTRQRFEIFKRDGFICQYCGGHPPSVILHVDHIIPVSKNGTNDRENLITSCSRCNLGKSNVLLTTIPESVILKSDEIKEKEKQLKGYYKIVEQKRQRLDSEIFRICATLNESYSKSVSRDYYISVKNFIEKLDFYDVLESMEIAVSKCHNEYKAWKYFCGICWTKIKNK